MLENMMQRRHHPAGTTTRRSLLTSGPAALALAAATVLIPGRLLAQETEEAQIDDLARGDIPTTGGLRPGPVGMNPAKIRRKGVTPVSMVIEKAGVDAQVESQPIEDGRMLDPSGPYVVAWYEDTGGLGELTNLVFAGHLDYYDVGEAVFYELHTLVEEDEIQITGEDGETYSYAVEWGRNYTVDELTSEAIREIVGKTDDEAITLITCGGPFDFNVGQYLERYVVRALRG
jgi:hypothetical protein